MRGISHCVRPLGLSLAVLLAAASLADAQHYAHHPAPYVGSVHYGGQAYGGQAHGGFEHRAFEHGYRYLGPSTVHYEHYHTTPGIATQRYFPQGGYAPGAYLPGSYGPGYYRNYYRNPYAAGYLAGASAGWFPVVLSGAQYYAYNTLPFGYQSVVVNGLQYYLLNGIYYQPYLYQGQTVYMIVPPPVP
jgi:hypothetical protein